MDGTSYQQFFREPSQPQQRRYEALRAFFLEGRSLPDIARQFGFAHGTLRNLVSLFRSQCQADVVPPFSFLHRADDHRAAPARPAHDPIRPPLPTAARCR